jgi:phage terminase Nu1 subunit (DNA packaging protein)
LLSLSVRHFSRLESEGAVTAATKSRGRGSRYDAAVLVRQYLAYRERLIRGSHQSPRDRRDSSLAALNELKLSREQRDVLPRAEVVRAGVAVMTVVGSKLRGLPGRLVRLGVIPAEGEAAVAAEVDMVQEELSRLKAADILEGESP